LPRWLKTIGGAVGAFYTLLGIPNTGEDIAKWSPVLQSVQEYLVGGTPVTVFVITCWVALVGAQVYVTVKARTAAAPSSSGVAEEDDLKDEPTLREPLPISKLPSRLAASHGEHEATPNVADADGLKAQLQQAWHEGEAIKQALPKGGPARSLHPMLYSNPTGDTDVEHWEAHVGHLLSHRPELISVFKYQPGPPPMLPGHAHSHRCLLAHVTSKSEQRIGRRLTQLDHIIKGL